MPNRQYYQFIERIKAIKSQTLPKDLLACINQEALMDIADDILEDMTHQKRMKGLMPNQGCRFNKKHSGLARTFSVLRDPQGNFQCILETKSKNAANKKQKIETAEGGFKSGKAAWRIDAKNGPQPYFSLVLVLKENGKLSDLTNAEVVKKLKELKEEIALPWEFDKAAGLQRNTLGAIYTNRKGLVASIYSKKGIPLNKALQKKMLICAQREVIANSLLNTISKLHHRSLVFQDLKPANILLFYKKNGQLKVRLTDPGHVSKPSRKETSVATAGYESPEIALGHSSPSAFYHEYYQTEYKKKGISLGKQVANKWEKTQIKKSAVENIKQQKAEGLEAHQANDMWAMGVTLYKLFRNHKPRNIPTEQRFAGFFKPRESRITADEALAQWKKPKKIIY
jgi:hypothetical protein